MYMKLAVFHFVIWPLGIHSVSRLSDSVAQTANSIYCMVEVGGCKMRNIHFLAPEWMVYTGQSRFCFNTLHPTTPVYGVARTRLLSSEGTSWPLDIQHSQEYFLLQTALVYSITPRPHLSPEMWSGNETRY